MIFSMDLMSRYESIIATLCESLDTLDEPEAKVLLEHLFKVKNLVPVPLLNDPAYFWLSLAISMFKNLYVLGALYGMVLFT